MTNREAADRIDRLLDDDGSKFTCEMRNALEIAIEVLTHHEGTSSQDGYWVYDANGMDYGLPAWTCSVCDFSNDMLPVSLKYPSGYIRVKNPMIFAGSSYCPNCGAKMKGVEGGN